MGPGTTAAAQAPLIPSPQLWFSTAPFSLGTKSKEPIEFHDSPAGTSPVPADPVIVAFSPLTHRLAVPSSRAPSPSAERGDDSMEFDDTCLDHPVDVENIDQAQLLMIFFKAHPDGYRNSQTRSNHQVKNTVAIVRVETTAVNKIVPSLQRGNFPKLDFFPIKQWRALAVSPSLSLHNNW